MWKSQYAIGPPGNYGPSPSICWDNEDKTKWLLQTLLLIITHLDKEKCSEIHSFTKTVGFSLCTHDIDIKTYDSYLATFSKLSNQLQRLLFETNAPINCGVTTKFENSSSLVLNNINVNIRSSIVTLRNKGFLVCQGGCVQLYYTGRFASSLIV